jgi:hypothetical protein
MLAFNENTVVLANYLDDRLWRQPVNSTEFDTNQIRVLYAGTSSHRDDLAFLGRAVRKLTPAYRERLRIEIVGVVQATCEDWFQAARVPPWIAGSYPEFVGWIQNQNRWHWGVAPLLDTPFNSSKSGLKYLEYSALGLPSICSDTVVYQDIVQSPEAGILAVNDVDCWTQALEGAVTDAKLWGRLHQNCRGVVDQNSLSANAETIKSLWTDLAKGNRLNVLAQGASM